jgi:hypothetical protein
MRFSNSWHRRSKVRENLSSHSGCRYAITVSQINTAYLHHAHLNILLKVLGKSHVTFDADFAVSTVVSTIEGESVILQRTYFPAWRGLCLATKRSSVFAAFGLPHNLLSQY